MGSLPPTGARALPAPNRLREAAHHWLLLLVNSFQQPMGSLGVSRGAGRGEARPWGVRVGGEGAAGLELGVESVQSKSIQSSARSGFILGFPRSPLGSLSPARSPNPTLLQRRLPCLQGPGHQGSSVGEWQAWAPETAFCDLPSCLTVPGQGAESPNPSGKCSAH